MLLNLQGNQFANIYENYLSEPTVFVEQFLLTVLKSKYNFAAKKKHSIHTIIMYEHQEHKVFFLIQNILYLSANTPHNFNNENEINRKLDP